MVIALPNAFPEIKNKKRQLSCWFGHVQNETWTVLLVSNQLNHPSKGLLALIDRVVFWEMIVKSLSLRCNKNCFVHRFFRSFATTWVLTPFLGLGSTQELPYFSAQDSHCGASYPQEIEPTFEVVLQSLWYPHPQNRLEMTWICDDLGWYGPKNHRWWYEKTGSKMVQTTVVLFSCGPHDCASVWAVQKDLYENKIMFSHYGMKIRNQERSRLTVFLGVLWILFLQKEKALLKQLMIFRGHVVLVMYCVLWFRFQCVSMLLMFLLLYCYLILRCGLCLAPWIQAKKEVSKGKSSKEEKGARWAADPQVVFLSINWKGLKSTKATPWTEVDWSWKVMLRFVAAGCG